MAKIEISCREVWQEISSYIDGEIDPILRMRMEEHFKICAHCYAILDGARNVVRIMGDDEVFELPSGFSQRLQKKLETAISG